MVLCSKRMSPSVRIFSAQGKKIKDTRMNSSFDFHQVIDGKAIDVALGWLVAFGSLFTFANTLEQEHKSDIRGEWAFYLMFFHGDFTWCFFIEFH